MSEVIAGFEAAALWACVIGLLLLAAIGMIGLLKQIARSSRRDLPPGTTFMLLVMAIMGVIYGGSKATVSINDPYITDNGSYVTNDYVHIAIAKRTAILPDSTEILVYYRPIASTNATDWMELSPRLTFTDFPYDYPLESATNYNFMVGASYTPEPTVHTNGVWQIKGFLMPGYGGRASFVNTRVRIIEEPVTNDVLTVTSEESP